MTDRPRGRARQPHPNPTKRPPPQPHKRQRPDRGGSGRARPHPRTVHDLDPRKAAFETMRRLSPGDLLEPAVQATLRYQGYGPDAAHRVLPMLEDAVRFAFLFDHLIAHLASRKPSDLDPDVRAALHLFLAWYLLDDPTSAYAHGNAAVNLLSPQHKGRGFVNALVRRLGEFVRVEQTEPEDYRALVAAHQPPPLWADRARLGAGRMLVAERAILPDPATELASHLSIVGSLPRWLVEKLIEQHGPEAATQIAIACIERPATWLRPNPLKADWKEIAEWWTVSGTSVERVPTPFHGDALALPAKLRSLTEHPGWANGAFYVQDYSAQLVAPALEASPGETLLDLCSAPGGKAGHLAELTDDRAKILACDVTMPKVELIQQNIARMGYRSIATVQADAGEVKFPEPFDRVLVDAPCSNSGVLARRVEARHRINEQSVQELTALQLKILENAAANLSPGGALVYSVCSILLDEGPDVVHRFLRGKVGDKRREDIGWEVEYENYLLPVPAFHDGGYVARLHAPG
ncbi:MAG: methyltransferase domain-containing protein [Planctomycetes bacterium]|nr:methyltransferase domain-containing protein [Planctomycetota bacterium]